MNEDKIVKDIGEFFQYVVNEYTSKVTEYNNFITNESVDVNSILDCLNSLRLTKKIIDFSKEFIQDNNINANLDMVQNLNVQDQIAVMKEVQISISDALKEYKQLYDNSIDMEDEEEYQKIVKLVRNKRKFCNNINDICNGVLAIYDSFIPIGSEKIKNIYEESAGIEVNETKEEVNLEVNETKEDTEVSETKENNSYQNNSYIESAYTKNSYQNNSYTESVYTGSVYTEKTNNSTNNINQDMQEDNKINITENMDTTNNSCEVLENIASNNQADNKSHRIVVSLKGTERVAKSYTDEICIICEFLIKMKPFKMAHIFKLKITLNNKQAFCRTSSPIDGYVPLSNGLLVIAVDNEDDVKDLTYKILKYCQVDDKIIKFIE